MRAAVRLAEGRRRRAACPQGWAERPPRVARHTARARGRVSRAPHHLLLQLVQLAQRLAIKHRRHVGVHLRVQRAGGRRLGAHLAQRALRQRQHRCPEGRVERVELVVGAHVVQQLLQLLPPQKAPGQTTPPSIGFESAQEGLRFSRAAAEAQEGIRGPRAVRVRSGRAPAR
eukprot:5820504-Prymnesium_polylepis.1